MPYHNSGEDIFNEAYVGMPPTLRMIGRLLYNVLWITPHEAIFLNFMDKIDSISLVS